MVPIMQPVVPVVGIIDYQMGNLRSVEKAIAKSGGQPVVSGDAKGFSDATHLILPGVGAFRDAISELKRRDLIPLIHDWVGSGKPFLGICLGLQLLFDASQEGGTYEGLGLIPGEVIRFDFENATDVSSASEISHRMNLGTTSSPTGVVGNAAVQLKVPHMGWNQVTSQQPDDPWLEGIPAEPYFYFVHSYFAVPTDPNDVWLTSHYGHPFCAAIRRNNIAATQFHPEKSQANGLRLLKNFLSCS
jgi:glutamine amidotransferase